MEIGSAWFEGYGYALFAGFGGEIFEIEVLMRVKGLVDHAYAHASWK